jgi:hypothetical protein
MVWLPPTERLGQSYGCFMRWIDVSRRCRFVGIIQKRSRKTTAAFQQIRNHKKGLSVAYLIFFCYLCKLNICVRAQ